nr:LRR receptor-like serine/threonine-protein kinase GSO1 [Ipomoea batatas]
MLANNNNNTPSSSSEPFATLDSGSKGMYTRTLLEYVCENGSKGYGSATGERGRRRGFVEGAEPVDAPAAAQGAVEAVEEGDADGAEESFRVPRANVSPPRPLSRRRKMSTRRRRRNRM